jgi:hypothetical protein
VVAGPSTKRRTSRRAADTRRLPFRSAPRRVRRDDLDENGGIDTPSRLSSSDPDPLDQLLDELDRAAGSGNRTADDDPLNLESPGSGTPRL